MRTSDDYFPLRDFYREQLEAAHKHGACVEEAMTVLDGFAKTIHDLREANRRKRKEKEPT
jgi:hypothetical protein